MNNRILKVFIICISTMVLLTTSMLSVFAAHNTLGTYHWSAQPTKHDDFEEWLGREQEYVLDFAGQDTWYGIEAPWWLTGVWKNTKYKENMI